MDFSPPSAHININPQGNRLETMDYFDPNFGSRVEAQITKLTKLAIIRLNDNQLPVSFKSNSQLHSVRGLMVD